ncbi:lipoyl(octanoyl) transferase LipB [Halobacteriovorax sp.]|uniref:lipoyl(octanoyl) transferase LipB n=1 Tax=Halobacteriovorax sp. TaxID=2020862 RepID=UPI0035613EC5
MNFFDGLTLSEFDLTFENIHIKGKNTFYVIKENWSYELALLFQEEVVQRVYLDKKVKVIILCSHPHCLTLGRGLQRRTKADTFLIDFDNELREVIGIPIHDIKRGGGVTFHHPGQLVLYPIVSLENCKKKVMDFLREILNEVKGSLESLYDLTNLSCEEDLIGIWTNDKKLASIGLCSHKFITYHGLALNLYLDEKMQKVLSNIYPCGISGDRYISLDQITKHKDNFFEEISSEIIQSSSLFGE